MSKTLESILTEMYDGNTISPEYTNDYIRNFLRATEYSPLDSVPLDSDVNSIETSPEDFHEALVQFIHSGDDELTIEYDDGHEITLEDEIAKILLAKSSVEELENAARNSDYMHDLLSRACDGVEDCDEYDEAEELLSDDVKNPCWKGYEMSGTKNKNGKKVPNCIKENKDEIFKIISERIEHQLTEALDEIRAIESDQAISEQRFKIINRVRGGKVQRRRKVSTTPGYRFQNGRLVRISAREKLNRRRGQRRGSIKRKSKLAGALRRRKISIRKRGNL